MKKLVCEMCGSADLLKKDGVFECQSCGTKYTVEEAKKMMVEGVVQVEGKVKIDNSGQIDNYLKLAKNAYKASNNSEAESYANKIIEIDFLKCFKALLRNYKITLFVTLIAFTIGIGTTSFVIDSNNEYEATSSVYGIVYGSFTDSSDILNSLKAYGEVVKSHKIAERASLLIGDDTIDKDKIYDMISVEYDSSTLDYSAIIYIHATYYDKDVAIDVANAVAEAFVLEIANLTGKNDIQILDTADNATISYNANQTKIKTLAISIILGFIIGCAYIVIKEIFSDKMYAPKDATDYGKLDIIGVIPDFDTDKDFNLYLSDNDTN